MNDFACLNKVFATRKRILASKRISLLEAHSGCNVESALEEAGDKAGGRRPGRRLAVIQE